MRNFIWMTPHVGGTSISYREGFVSLFSFFFRLNLRKIENDVKSLCKGILCTRKICLARCRDLKGMFASGRIIFFHPDSRCINHSLEIFNFAISKRFNKKNIHRYVSSLSSFVYIWQIRRNSWNQMKTSSSSISAFLTLLFHFFFSLAHRYFFQSSTSPCIVS